MTRRVFISGPISRGDLTHNINQATAAFVELAKAGLAPFCPHWSVYSKPCYPVGPAVTCIGTASGNDEMVYEDWMAVDLPWVRVSDAVLRLPGESAGADRETAEAEAHSIPVFHAVADVIRWAASSPAVAARPPAGPYPPALEVPPRSAA